MLWTFGFRQNYLYVIHKNPLFFICKGVDLSQAEQYTCCLPCDLLDQSVRHMLRTVGQFAARVCCSIMIFKIVPSRSVHYTWNNESYQTFLYTSPLQVNPILFFQTTVFVYTYSLKCTKLNKYALVMINKPVLFYIKKIGHVFFIDLLVWICLYDRL